MILQYVIPLSYCRGWSLSRHRPDALCAGPRLRRILARLFVLRGRVNNLRRRRRRPWGRCTGRQERAKWRRWRSRCRDGGSGSVLRHGGGRGAAAAARRVFRPVGGPPAIAVRLEAHRPPPSSLPPTNQCALSVVFACVRRLHTTRPAVF